MSNLKFEDRVALVTGAGSGIGRATALRLAEGGACVAAVDLSADTARETVSQIETAGGKAAVFACDVGNSDVVIETVRSIEGELGSIDILANVAGTGDTAGLEGIAGLDDERWNRVLAVNLSGPFFLCRAIVPGMAERGRGAVVNVSSLAGRSKSANGGIAYTSSKAGLLGLTRHLAFDYGSQGVRTNAICPGGVDTPMIRAGGVAAAGSKEEAEARSQRIEAYTYFMPIKRLSSPDEQAAVICFLASDDASYINGVALDVNGGLFMA
jgi:meso-butanediol dehydrogenase/(S,S)-butanediol dehydrogenase/diacetyl reductase